MRFTPFPSRKSDLREILLRFTFEDGTQNVTHVGIYINTVTGECSNSDNTGMGGLGFNFNIAELTMYATVDCWMRSFGFCFFYDVIAGSMPWFLTITPADSSLIMTVRNG